jgi:tetratricopeptide (TPR) repeat protein
MDSEHPADPPSDPEGPQHPNVPPPHYIGEQPYPGEEDPVLSVQALLKGHEHENIATVFDNVPPRNPVFTGRNELMEQLEQRLSQENVAAVLPAVLHGMGGVGKSQIAIEYVYRHLADYDIVWWVPSEQLALILASLIKLGNRLGLGLDIGLEVNTAVPQVREALRSGEPYSNWLIVFDNAETIDTVRDYLPESGPGKVLVISRNPARTALAQTLEVDVFTRQESIRLLQRRNQRLSDEDCDRLAEALGDLPLAIEHGSAWLYTTGMEVPEYLALFEQKRAELSVLVPERRYEMPVAAAASVALDRLAVENPAALQLLQVCSFFAPEPIGRDLFIRPRLTPIAPELDAALQEPHQLNQAIRDILRYVLVRLDYRTNTIQLHRLVQSVLQNGMSEEQQRKMEHGAHVLLAGGRLGAPADKREWLRYQALASHLIASNAVMCSDDWARELILNLIAFYYYWGDYSSSLSLSRRVVAEWQRMLGNDHEQTLRGAKWLGFLLRVTGDYSRAAAVNADSLERYRRTVGPDDEGTVDAMAVVAADLRVSGRFAEARELDLDAFQRARRVFGEDDPETLRSALSLGVSLRLTGDFRTARQLDGDTYRRSVAVLGDDHPETLRILNNMTLDERECGEYVKAHRLTERLYQRYSRIFGAKHPETIEVARNLAVARRRAGDHDGAYKLSEATLNRSRELYGPVHPRAIAAALDLAVDIRESDDLQGARGMAEKTAELYESALGPEHPYTLYARTNLGIVLRLLGDLDAAYRQNLVAWDSLSGLLGPNHLLTLTCAINLASDHAALGDHQRAYTIDTETLDRCRQVIGQEHPTTLAVALNLALDLASLGRHGESEALFARTLDSYRRVLGADHPALAAARARVRANCDFDPMPF